MNNLYLQFEIYYNEDINDVDITDEDNNQIRCLVCMNVDENSELRDGDKGFAACYRPFTGSFWSSSDSFVDNAATNYDNPEWEFLGEVKAVNKGEAVKSTGKNGWKESFTWNKQKDSFEDWCGYDSEYTTDNELYYMYVYHDS